MLVSKCRIYDEDNIARSTYYKIISEKKGKDHNQEKSYGNPFAKNNHKN